MEVLKKDIAIYYEVWPVEKPKMALQLFHGMCEHITRYEKLAKFLNEQGILVYGMDDRGHGRTGDAANSMGYFGDKDGWLLVLQDQKDLYQHMRRQYPELPFAVLGHSMGSFLARDYINQYPNDFERAIIMGTGAADDPSYRFGRFILKFLNKKATSKFIHGLAFGGFIKKFPDSETVFDWISRDREEIQKYIEDPYCGIDVTNGFYRDFMQGMKRIEKAEKNIKYTKPMLFVAGDKDPVGEDGNKVKEVFAKYRAKTMASLILYEGMRHEILNELDDDKVYEDILHFLEK